MQFYNVEIAHHLLICFSLKVFMEKSDWLTFWRSRENVRPRDVQDRESETKTSYQTINVILLPVDSARNLGVIFDTNMSFAQHISPLFLNHASSIFVT